MPTVPIVNPQLQFNPLPNIRRQADVPQDPMATQFDRLGRTIAGAGERLMDYGAQEREKKLKEQEREVERIDEIAVLEALKNADITANEAQDQFSNKTFSTQDEAAEAYGQTLKAIQETYDLSGANLSENQQKKYRRAQIESTKAHTIHIGRVWQSKNRVIQDQTTDASRALAVKGLADAASDPRGFSTELFTYNQEMLRENIDSDPRIAPEAKDLIFNEQMGNAVSTSIARVLDQVSTDPSALARANKMYDDALKAKRPLLQGAQAQAVGTMLAKANDHFDTTQVAGTLVRESKSQPGVNQTSDLDPRNEVFRASYIANQLAERYKDRPEKLKAVNDWAMMELSKETALARGKLQVALADFQQKMQDTKGDPTAMSDAYYKIEDPFLREMVSYAYMNNLEAYSSAGVSVSKTNGRGDPVVQRQNADTFLKVINVGEYQTKDGEARLAFDAMAAGLSEAAVKSLQRAREQYAKGPEGITLDKVAQALSLAMGEPGKPKKITDQQQVLAVYTQILDLWPTGKEYDYQKLNDLAKDLLIQSTYSVGGKEKRGPLYQALAERGKNLKLEWQAGWSQDADAMMYAARVPLEEQKAKILELQKQGGTIFEGRPVDAALAEVQAKLEELTPVIPPKINRKYIPRDANDFIFRMSDPGAQRVRTTKDGVPGTEFFYMFRGQKHVSKFVPDEFVDEVDPSYKHKDLLKDPNAHRAQWLLTYKAGIHFDANGDPVPKAQWHAEELARLRSAMQEQQEERLTTLGETRHAIKALQEKITAAGGPLKLLPTIGASADQGNLAPWAEEYLKNTSSPDDPRISRYSDVMRAIENAPSQRKQILRRVMENILVENDVPVTHYRTK